MQSHEGETELQTEGAQEDIAVEAEQPHHGRKLPPALPTILPHRRCQLPQLTAYQPDADCQRAVVRHDRGCRHTPHLPAEPEHKQGIERHIDQIGEDQHHHGAAGILHPQQPTHDHQIAERRRGAPDPHRHILARIELHLGRAATQGDQPWQQGEEQQQQRQAKSNGQPQRPQQSIELGTTVGGAVRLRRQAGGRHPQKAEQPEDEVDQGRTDRDAPQKPGLTEMTDHPGVHQPQQGGGDIGENHRQGERKDGAVARGISPPGGNSWGHAQRPANFRMRAKSESMVAICTLGT